MASHNVKKLLFDVQQAGELIASFVRGKSHEDYRSDRMLQSAVERQFEIIGEALRQAIGIDAEISTRVVWGIVEEHLPRLPSEVQGRIVGTE